MKQKTNKRESWPPPEELARDLELVKTGTKVWVNKYVAAMLTGLAPETLKGLRSKGELRQGIHWQAINCRAVRYNAPLLQDWMANRDRPEIHAETQRRYQQARTPRRRKSSRTEEAKHV